MSDARGLSNYSNMAVIYLIEISLTFLGDLLKFLRGGDRSLQLIITKGILLVMASHLIGLIRSIPLYTPSIALIKLMVPHTF